MGKVIDMHRGRSASHDKMAGWLRRAERLEDALRARAPFSADDQARAAANLHGLLERLAAEGLRKRDVVAEAGLERGPTDSTKRLDTITLPPAAGEARLVRLAKKPKLYFEVAKAIGRLRDEPAAPHLCAIFEGCSFGAGVLFESDSEEARWVKLADQIRRMAASVVRSEDVTRYWHDVCRSNGTYDPVWDCIVVSNDMIDRLGSEAGLAHDAAYPGDMAPVPSALVGERTYVPWQENRVIFRDGGRIDVRARVQTEVRIALAPAHSDGEIAPLLEFRSRLDIEDREGQAIVPDNRYCDGTGGSDTVAFVHVDGEWREVAEFLMRNVPQAEFRHDFFEAVYRAWEPVSAARLRTLFGNDEQPFDQRFEMTHLPPGTPANNQPVSRFATGTPAFALSARILTGALETALVEDCRRIRKLLDDHCEAQAEAVARAEAEAEARWSVGASHEPENE